MRVLQVTTYSLDQPRHGGQIRCSEIRRHLENSGHEVVTFCVLQPGEVSVLNPSITVGHEVRPPNEGNGDHFSDIELHFSFREVKELERLLKAIPEGDFDVVLAEQPWMFDSLKKCFQNAKKQPFFILSGQNNEIELKTAIAAGLSGSERVLAKVSQEVYEIEKNAVSRSDAVIAVTAADAQHYRDLGANVVFIVANATSRPEAKARMSKTLLDVQYFLFVGSAHLPNFDGFKGLIGHSLSFLPPNFRIVCVGSICELLAPWLESPAVGGEFSSRMQLVGQVRSEELLELIGSARAILLPILTGSGSNLKTAEALASGRPIIASQIAMRGYEHWLGGPGLTLADTKADFVEALVASLSSGEWEFDVSRPSSREHPLYWDDAMSALDLTQIVGGAK